MEAQRPVGAVGNLPRAILLTTCPSTKGIDRVRSPAVWRIAAGVQRMKRLSGGTSAMRLMRTLSRAAVRLLVPRTAVPKRRAPRIAKPLPLPWPSGVISEVGGFGSNPGALTMHVYTPRGSIPPGMPLVVVLHGCRQDATRFAHDSGWIEWADRAGVALLLPGQVAANQRNRCFNWYRPSDVRRGQGEAMSIRQMIRAATIRFRSDGKRIFIVGLSAGGAMAVAMLAAYPAVFAGGAVVAGMPVGAASTSPMALLRMYRADPFGSRAGLVAAARSASPARGNQPWPRLSIWQGEVDRVVDPGNAELLAAQWGGLHGCDPAPIDDAALTASVRCRSWGRPGRPVVELWTLAELAHGFPIATGAGRAAPWVLDAGLAAVPRIAAFWGLGDNGIQSASG